MSVNEKALVLDGNQRSSLAVVRSLGRRGVQVYVAGHTEFSLAGSSRYAKRYAVYPDPVLSPREFVDWLVTYLAENNIRYLQPVTEVTSRTILDNLSRIPDSCVVPFADPSTVLALSDKGRLVELADELGVAVPRTLLVDPSQNISNAQPWGFPCVLKPVLSNYLRDGVWRSAGVRIAKSALEYNRIIAGSPSLAESPYLIQEYIEGHGAAIFALYDNGQEVAHFAHTRLRERPPQGGVSVLSMSVEPDPEMLEYARRLLGESKWHGVAMVEFRVDGSGKSYLMEVNTRFWGSLQLAIDSGVDFPWLLYAVTNGRKVDKPDHYRFGQVLRWMFGDLESLYLYLRSSEHSYCSKVHRFVSFLRPRFRHCKWEPFRWDDPMPAIVELKSALRTIARGAP